MNSPENNEQRRSGGGETWRTAESAQRENETWRSIESDEQHLHSPETEKKSELRGTGGVTSILAEGRSEDRGSRMEDRESRMEDRGRMEDCGSRMDDRAFRMEPSRFSPQRHRNRSTTPDEEDSTSFHETYERDMLRRRRGKKSLKASLRICWFQAEGAALPSPPGAVARLTLMATRPTLWPG